MWRRHGIDSKSPAPSSISGCAVAVIRLLMNQIISISNGMGTQRVREKMVNTIFAVNITLDILTLNTVKKTKKREQNH